MKNRIILTGIVLAAALTVNAQGGFQRTTVEERVKIVHHKIDSAFKPSAENLKQIDDVFTTYYKEQDKLREELMGGGGRPDMEAWREKQKPITEKRDAALKKLLSDEQYKKYIDEIEPALRPRGRGPGGGGQGGGRNRN